MARRLTPRSVDDTRQRVGYSEFGVVGLLAVIGALVLIETQSIHESKVASATLGPRVVPYAVGILMLVITVLLAIDIARGGRGEAEAGEDIDLSHGTDWKTLFALAVVVAATGYLIPLIGFPIAGAALVFIVSRLLGSKKLLLDAAVSVGLATAAFLVFTGPLGIYLPLWGGE